MRYPSLLILALAVGSYGQESSRLVFDVASIRPHLPRTDPSSMQVDNGVLIVKNFSLRQLIEVFFPVQDYRLLGGPSWTVDEGWDIQAKTLNDTSADDKSLPEQERAALRLRLGQRSQHLLEDRFGLVLLREIRIETTYELHVERGGHKLERAKEGVAASVTYPRMGIGRSSVAAASIPIQSLALILSGRLGRPVADKTEIAGLIDFRLDWIPEIGEPGAVTRPNAPKPDGPSIFTAVKEQLGLRLEPVKGPMEVLVVEKAERPSEN